MSVRYTLSARAPFSADWRKGTHDTLAAALSVAWRRYKREWSIDNISRGQSIVFDSDGMMRAFSRMDEIMRETPKLSLGEVAEQVIREMDIHDDAQERAGAPEGSDEQKSRR